MLELLKELRIDIFLLFANLIFGAANVAGYVYGDANLAFGLIIGCLCFMNVGFESKVILDELNEYKKEKRNEDNK